MIYWLIFEIRMALSARCQADSKMNEGYWLLRVNYLFFRISWIGILIKTRSATPLS